MFHPWLRAHLGSPHREKCIRKLRIFLMTSSKDICIRKKSENVPYMVIFWYRIDLSTFYKHKARIYFMIDSLKEYYYVVDYNLFCLEKITLGLSFLIKSYHKIIIIYKWNYLYKIQKLFFWVASEWSAGTQKHQLHCAYPDTKIIQFKMNFNFGKSEGS